MEIEQYEIIQELDDLFQPLEFDDKRTSEDIIRENIDKANFLFDIALAQVSAPDSKGRIATISGAKLEAISKLIDSITKAAETLISAESDQFGLQIKADMVRLKERELQLKNVTVPVGHTQNNIFVSTFSDLVKQIKNIPRDNEVLLER